MVSRHVLSKRIVGVLAISAVWLVCARGQAGVTIGFDYTYDALGFFDDPLRRELLELGAAQINRFIDHLEAIVPSGSNHWSYWVHRPDDPNWALVTDDTIPTDTIKVYVGGRPLSSRFLALTSTSEVWTISGSEDWEDTVYYRGEGGAAGDPATDYSLFAGAITFNTIKPWHFGHTTDGLSEDNTDFLTVAMHELFHILGYGPAKSWQDEITDGKFTGAHAVSVGSPNNPELVLDSAGAHWDSGTLGPWDGISQLALLSPAVARDDRRWPTGLDRAGLRDIGWQEAAAGDTDLDRDIDSRDIQMILAAFKFGAGPSNAAWFEGDFDGNQLVDGLDIQMIQATGLFDTGPYASAAPGDPPAFRNVAPIVDLVLDPAAGSLAWIVVPEPNTVVMLAGGALALLVAIRRRKA